MTPKVDGILETGIYVEDVERSREFYERVFGLEPIFAEERMCTLAVAPAQVLIIFKRHSTLTAVPVGDGFIPPHDGDGPQHFAFAVADSEIEAWKNHLGEQGVMIESSVDWPQGGWSLYFRDPDGLLVELATPGIWKKN